MEVKSLSAADSSAFLDLLLKLDNETKFMMMEPGERDTSVENTQNRLSNINESMTALLGAYDGESLIGFISLSRSEANRAKHSAYIVMGVLSLHTGKGIGKLLFNSAEEWAKWHNVSRLELTVMTHNENAIKLYERVGFIKEGIKKNSLLVDGEYVDEFYMSKILG
jgi:RimJ/RimL family protein N-acetyltransferase